MKLLKVGAAVLNQTPLDWEGNAANIRAAIAEARQQGVSLLCLPELCISGYNCEDAFHMPAVARTSYELLRELKEECAGMVVSFGIPVVYRNALYNCACLVVDGEIAGFVAKRFLPGDGIHYEPRWFKPWPEGVMAELRIGDAVYPMGDLFFEVDGVRIGFEICEDAWVADRPGARLSRLGVDVILNPSASHFAFGKIEIRKRFVIEGSRAFGLSYIYANLLGNEAGRAIYDGASLIASEGKLLAQGPRFQLVDHLVTTAVIDVDATRTERARNASYRPLFEEWDEDLVVVPHRFPEAEPEAPRIVDPSWEQSERRKEEEFTRAEVVALLDYLRKSRAQGYVVSLSGGADSAAVATLVALMVEQGVAELGLEGFRERLGHVPALRECEDVRAMVGALLTCAYQSTENSGDVTRRAARLLCEDLGATFHELDVDALVKSYVALAEGAIGRSLDWERDDRALQNIQARARGPSIWMLANLRGAVLLATSNRSEAAVGYATMDGDTCGGLSPIAGIDKAFLRRWLRWVQAEGATGMRTVPALEAVNAQQPTAELRPPAAGQTDEGDLMPYPVLDAIEGLAIRDKRSPVEVYRLMVPTLTEEERPLLAGWVAKFFRLWCVNQWKRERYAPAFHLDDKNLDPRSWCRFPILSGGFRRELAELERLAGEVQG